MRCKTKDIISEMALKIDISKAFGRVGLNYLLSIMSSMGFHKMWVGLMKLYLEIVHYSVLVNGDFVWFISLGRELRQGDPISPYLFILYTILKDSLPFL